MEFLGTVSAIVSIGTKVADSINKVREKRRIQRRNKLIFRLVFLACICFTFYYFNAFEAVLKYCSDLAKFVLQWF
ncbi:hypothetical protein [Campylobacter mucosalis]|uniref:Uncharacterized protein n=1 Tax=Campylobacter mucosalis CCUG 21559 TaxID=1032067 RepID=A0A6G5QGN6_9BACT|nr:hypothetical protein [Campylobacter mucosalis]KEA46298.1 hypothetical protein CR66_03710 [Campylobacter mucosalis]QCD44855.1 hypothetical protein CMUC_1074 [Campylobacter mucosalis CCUG 21559]QKF62771.1 hypothetical protein CMCT_0617 [Campylobacter mucosalis]